MNTVSKARINPETTSIRNLFTWEYPQGAFYTSQVKYVNQLEENVSRVAGQNSLTPQGDRNLLTSLGNDDWNFRLARDEAVPLETAANLSPSRRQANNVFAVFYFRVEWYNT